MTMPKTSDHEAEQSSETAAEPALPNATSATEPEVSSTAWPLRFTGSGSEYFRIWIVNLLLTLVTLTLYWPFARARKLRYFYNNTWVGEDALGFHADPWRMFRAYLLTLVMGVAYWSISHFAPTLSWMPLLVLALFWPVLWQSSLIFRMRNTSYRGLRFDFQGTSKGAYRVLLPLWIPAVLMATASSFSVALGIQDRTSGLVLMASAGFVTTMVFFLFPWLLARMHAYQQGGFVFAAERAHLPALGLTRSIYKLVLVMGAMWMGFAVLFMLLVFGLAQNWKNSWLVSLLPLLLIAVVFLISPIWTARMQNLIWGQTRSENISIFSALRYRDLLKAQFVNWLLIVMTLGLYWPFAAIRTAKVRLEAIEVKLQGDVNSWLAQAQRQQAGVLGDAAGDFFGVDMGL